MSSWLQNSCRSCTHHICILQRTSGSGKKAVYIVLSNNIQTRTVLSEIAFAADKSVGSTSKGWREGSRCCACHPSPRTFLLMLRDFYYMCRNSTEINRFACVFSNLTKVSQSPKCLSFHSSLQCCSGSCLVTVVEDSSTGSSVISYPHRCCCCCCWACSAQCCRRLSFVPIPRSLSF